MPYGGWVGMTDCRPFGAVQFFMRAGFPGDSALSTHVEFVDAKVKHYRTRRFVVQRTQMEFKILINYPNILFSPYRAEDLFDLPDGYKFQDFTGVIADKDASKIVVDFSETRHCGRMVLKRL